MESRLAFLKALQTCFFPKTAFTSPPMVRSLAVVHFVKVNEPSSCTSKHPAVCTEINALLHKTS